jgi:hypothetical protein
MRCKYFPHMNNGRINTTKQPFDYIARLSSVTLNYRQGLYDSTCPFRPHQLEANKGHTHLEQMNHSPHVGFCSCVT